MGKGAFIFRFGGIVMRKIMYKLFIKCQEVKMNVIISKFPTLL